LQELQEYKRKIDQNDQESQQFKQKIQKLLGENTALGDEVRNAQENLRLSAATMNKLKAELDDYRGRISNNDQENNTIKMKMQTLIAENTSLGDEVRGAQENLRLSTATQAKLKAELDQFRNQMAQNNQESDTYKQKIQKLLSENNQLGDEVRNAQENLRLSASQIGKLTNEFKVVCNENEELKKRLQEIGGDVSRKIAEYENKIAMLGQELERLNGVIERKNTEIRALGGEIQEAQENIRLSNAQQSKLSMELNQFKSQVQVGNQESETYRQKIQKLMAENNQLGDEVRDAQENLRLSASQIGKLNNELKISCNEIEALQQRIQGMGEVGKRAAEYENKVAAFSQEIERLNGHIRNKVYNNVYL
jgi:chromosome segregation ATPase